MNDRNLISAYWDGVVAGLCVGLSVAVLIYVAWHAGAALAAGRL